MPKINATPRFDSAATVLAAIDAEQQRLRGIIFGRDQTLLAERPPNDDWSVVENLRHLLFTEQAHLGRFTSGGQQWSPLGLPPPGLQRKLQPLGVGTRPTSNVDKVLDAWQAAHASTRELAQIDSEPVRKALDKNLRHLRNHIKVIERLLRSGQRRQQPIP